MPHHWSDFRAGLTELINHKSGLAYDLDGFSHVNLVILDWYHLHFDASKYSTSLLVDDSVRQALVSTPFREVDLLIYSSASGNDDSGTEAAPDMRTPTQDLKRIRLKQLTLFDRFYCACRAINDHLEATGLGETATPGYINEVACGIVARLLACPVVTHAGVPYVRFGASAVALTEERFSILDYEEHPIKNELTVDVANPLSTDDESQILQVLSQHSMETGGFAEDAYDSPTIEQLILG